MLMIPNKADIYGIMGKHFEILVFKWISLWFMFSTWTKDKLKKLKEVNKTTYKVKENTMKKIWNMKIRNSTTKE